MNWIRNHIKNIVADTYAVVMAESLSILHKNKLQALEDYLGIEYFSGDKNKPHYRKKKVIVKKLGRPKKK